MVREALRIDELSKILMSKVPTVGLRLLEQTGIMQHILPELTDCKRIEQTKVGAQDVLGGGLVKGSLVLLGGEPGIGKSTILLQICEYLGKEHTILYVSGEESVRQIKLRADRLGVKTPNLYLLACSDAEQICSVVAKEKPEIVIIDSIQTMSIASVSSAQGSVSQVRECTNLFMRTAKSEEIPFS